MSAIYVTSDWHFMHDREFIWGPRECTDVYDMNEKIVQRHNEIVRPDDHVYVLGDLMLGRNQSAGLAYIRRLNGKIHVAVGNHDSPNRCIAYASLPNVVEVECGYRLKHGKYQYWLSHYPTLTGNHDEGKPLEHRVISLCGHVHTLDKFSDFDKGLIYHCEVDAHNLYPVPLEQIQNEIIDKVGHIR